ncbi:MAG: hypothetical protein IJD41_00565 [Alphaproteobacteria bacterium]|nr:hypothetical protein [Alphaproteobacteria bacterium]
MKRLIFLMSFVPIVAHAATEKANGERCIANRDCASLVCSQKSGELLRYCAAPAVLGESCSTKLGDAVYYLDTQKLCASGLKCDAGVCILGNAPATDCPSGYIAIDRPYITLATSCTSGTIAVGTAESCLVSNPAGDCIMYAPVGMSFTDESGTYEFTDACAME